MIILNKNNLFQSILKLRILDIAGKTPPNLPFTKMGTIPLCGINSPAFDTPFNITSPISASPPLKIEGEQGSYDSQRLVNLY